jgi:hypothetical protein
MKSGPAIASQTRRARRPWDSAGELSRSATIDPLAVHTNVEPAEPVRPSLNRLSTNGKESRHAHDYLPPGVTLF